MSIPLFALLIRVVLVLLALEVYQWVVARECNPLPNSRIACYELFRVQSLDIVRKIKQPLDEARAKRSNDFVEKKVSMRFRAFKKEFNVKLENSKHLFTKQFHVEVVDSIRRNLTHDLHLDRFYTGFLQGDNNSIVYGWLEGTNKEFDGVILTGNESFFVESALKYFVDNDENKLHSVIYRGRDIHFNESKQYFFGTKNATTIVDSSGFQNINEILRYRRKVDIILSKHKICQIHVIADHLFFKYVAGNSVGVAVKEIVLHIAYANIIYNFTEFDKLLGTTIGLKLHKISLFKDANGPGYSLAGEVRNAEEYLFKFSEIGEQNFRSFCLGVGFTYRDFSGVLGLAYIGKPHGAGICGYCKYREGGRRCYNTAIVTFLNLGKKVSRLTGTVTVAHEIGHSFGSEHDKVDHRVCSPGGGAGNYLMHPIAGTSQFPNNKLFSVCSITQMWPVIESNGYCMLDDNEPLCGNAVREAGEECDCGDKDHCDDWDHCCVPPGDTVHKPCTIRRHLGYTCSATSSLCCDSTYCQPVGKMEHKVCWEGFECSGGSMCDGFSASCPLPTPYPDGTPCRDGTLLCSRGVCSLSRCADRSMIQCQCMHKDFLCFLCCQNSSGVCAPYDEHPGQRSFIVLRRGELCNNYRGMCDHRGNCFEKDADAEQKFLYLFTSNGISRVKSWLQQYWYIVVACVAFLTVAGVAAKTKSYGFHVNLNLLAHRTGSLARVWFEARRAMRLTLTKARLVYHLKFKYSKWSTEMPVARARLRILFPSVPRNVIRMSVKQSSNEEWAVKRLLTEGFPFHKLDCERSSAV